MIITNQAANLLHLAGFKVTAVSGGPNYEISVEKQGTITGTLTINITKQVEALLTLIRDPRNTESSKYEIVELHAVHEGGEERSSGKPAWFYTDKSMAEDVAKGRGWYGGIAPITKVPAIKVGDVYYWLAKKDDIPVDTRPVDMKVLKEQALAKLTALERKALGFSQ